MQNIFISYRRDDAIDVTGRIADVLKGKLGEDVLFKDVDSIPLGTDFRRVIAAAVGRCDVLLAIIGDDWLEAKRKGEVSTIQAPSRRIDDPNDYVHIEIRAALERDIPVIPVLVERANMPQDKDLPEPLRPLAFRNAISVRPDPDFHNDMQRLCRALSGVVSPDPKPPKPRFRAAVVLAASLIVMMALSAAVYFLTPLKQLRALAPKDQPEEQAAKARSEEGARQEAERLNREKAEAEAQAAKARSEEIARQEAERLNREKAEAEAQAAKARSEEIARQEAEKLAASRAELLANQERLLQIAIANASWETAHELSAKLLEGGLPANRLGVYMQAIAKGRMEQELARKSKESKPSDLPASGFFDLDAVFANGPYADYHRASKTNIFKSAQNRLKARNFYQMEADGMPGAESQKALIAFQQDRAIPVSGRLDLATVEALGLLGLNDVKPSEVAPTRAVKSRTRSSDTSSSATAKTYPTPSRRAVPAPPAKKLASQSAVPVLPEKKAASRSSQPSPPPSPVDVILDQ